jgi:hypothetical protein
VDEKTISMAFLSAEKAEAVTNGWRNATISLSMALVGPFHYSF